MPSTRSCIAAAALLACVSAAQADPVTVAEMLPTTVFTKTTPFAGSANDTKTFTGLANGVHSVKFWMSGSELRTFTATFDGTAVPTTTLGPVSVQQLLGNWTTASQMPSLFTPFGTMTPGSADTGILEVSAERQPEAYAMVLAGLGALGLMISRRRNQG